MSLMRHDMMLEYLKKICKKMRRNILTLECEGKYNEYILGILPESQGDSKYFFYIFSL